MDRKKFIRKSLLGMGTIVGIPALLNACSKEDDPMPQQENNFAGNGGMNNGEAWDGSGECAVSPRETEGPYPIKTPAQLVRENIIGDRTGVALLLNITVKQQSSDCSPLAGVLVDVWHCDKDGNYSQYGSETSATYLRGRQTTDVNGQVSFISIFPGWYRGRAPHIHIEVLDADANSLLVSQIAFPEDVYTEVYDSSAYNGAPDTSNTQDGIFADSLEGNMADTVVGNITEGYTLVKNLMVP